MAVNSFWAFSIVYWKFKTKLSEYGQKKRENKEDKTRRDETTQDCVFPLLCGRDENEGRDEMRRDNEKTLRLSSALPTAGALLQ